jgi:hypothetical protein
MFVFIQSIFFRWLLSALAIGALLFYPAASLESLLPLSGAVAYAAVLPELPRIFLNTTYAIPSGPTITVPAGGDLQAALNTAQLGSVIVLQAGATYSGNFTLPSKAGSGWIYIQSSALASLPPPGTRVTPAQASLMPKIVGNPALTAASGAHHYRFVGIDITTTGAEVIVVVSLDGSNNITFDRSYIHGNPTGNVKYGVRANGTSIAVVDSYLSDFHHRIQDHDSLAIVGWNGAGPFKIINNYLEAATVNVMFGGGADSSSSSNIPSDIEIRGNHFFKPLSWMPGHPTYAGIPWIVKSIFELKAARRVLVDGNVFENNWTGGGQGGFAIVFTPRNQTGSAPWEEITDVTFTHNIIKRSTAGLNALGWDNISRNSGQLQRVLIRDNLFLETGAFPDLTFGGFYTGMLFHVTDGPRDLVIDHNTAFQTGTLLFAATYAGGWPALGFVFTNNIMPNNQGVTGAGGPLQTLNTLFTGYVFMRNALSGGLASSYPPDNFFPASLTQVGFVNLAAGDYHLALTSPYKNAGTDGKDLGADIDAITTATATAISGAGPVPPDTTPPVIALAEPLPGTTVSGTVTVSATATDNVAVTGVQFKLDGANLGAEDTIPPHSFSWNTATAIGGSHTLSAVARDAAGNQTTSATVSVTIADTTPPVVSGVIVSLLTSSTAGITWTTNEPSDSQVEYGLTTNYGSATPVAGSLVTAHAVTLNGLAAGTTYHYRVKSRDASTNLATSGDFTFSSTPLADTLPPSTPTDLAATAVSASQINLTWSPSTDNVGVAGYKIFRNGAEIASVSSGAFANTGLSSSSTYTYTVAAVDAAGNTSQQSTPASSTTPAAVAQSPYNGVPWPVPGAIEAEDFDQGGEGVAYHDLTPGNQGSFYRTDVDADIRQQPDGGVIVFNFETGEWLEYTITVSQAGTYRLELLVSSDWTTSRWRAEIDGVPMTGPVAIPHTGSWDMFQWVGIDGIPLTAGTHVLRIVADQEYFGFAALRLAQISSRLPFKGTPFSVPGQIEAEDFDQGGEGVAYHDLTPGNQGSFYRTDVDADIRQQLDGGVIVFNFQTGEWLEYTIMVSQTGTYRLELLVSCEWTTSRWHADVDGVSVTSSVAVPSTGSWNTFQWVGFDGIFLAEGTHVLRIVADQEYFGFAALRLAQVWSRAPFKGTPFSVPGQIEAEDFDQGGEGVAYHDLTPGNQGSFYRTDVDADIRQQLDGGVIVFNFQTGEWLEYTITVSQTGTYRLELLASCEWTTSRWHAEVDGVPITGTVAVPNTGSWNTFQWAGVGGIFLTAGTHVLRIVADQEYFGFAALRIVPE